MAIVEKRISVNEMEIGMYVSKLDRPWIETPFPLQGFLIRSQADLDMLRKYCKQVVIDEQLGRAKSIYRKPLPANAAQPVSDKVVPQKQKFARVKYSEPVAVEKEIQQVKAYHKQIHSVLDQLYSVMEKSGKVNFRVVRQTAGIIVNSVIRNPDALLWLTRLKVDRRSGYERAMRLSVLSGILGRHIGLPQEALENMVAAALLSEIGQPVTAETLRKESGLSGDERYQVRRHIETAIEKLQQSRVQEDVVYTVRYHHERFNGSGMLDGLGAGDIPLTARIVGLADVYDACIIGDDKTPGLPASQVVTQLNKYSDVLFQADLIENFIQAIGVYPTGTSVELKNGFKAAVIGQNPQRRLRPKLLIIENDKGERIKNGQIVDLLSENNAAYAIERTLPENLLAG